VAVFGIFGEVRPLPPPATPLSSSYTARPGDPQVSSIAPFGTAGMAVYYVLDAERVVLVLRVVWLG
jgi:hypothetical protein